MRKKRKIKTGGEKEKKARRVGADRGNRSRVADRRSSGTGWDNSEGRERENDSGNWMSGQRNKI